MEQLQPLITHRFWVLLVVALITPVVGWWLTTSSMQAQAESRRSEIESKFSSIPSGEVPNSDWERRLAKVNEVQEVQNKRARELLWREQTSHMVWPANVVQFVNQVGYRGQFNATAREVYRTSYPYEVYRVWSIVRPLEADPESGLVAFPYAAMPQEIWGDLPPTSEEMWNAQEDLWLLEALFNSIRNVNSLTNNRLEAAIRVLDTVQLVGGNRATLDTAVGEGEGEDMMSSEDYYSDMSEGVMPGAGFGGVGGEGRETNAAADFSPAEDFGSPALAVSETGEEEDMGINDMQTGYEDMGGLFGQQNQGRRYVDDEENLPFKTRGFYMSLVMDHRQLPQFLAELTSSPWPVRISRVHQVRLHGDDTTGETFGFGEDDYSSYQDGFDDSESVMPGRFQSSTPQMGLDEQFGGQSYGQSGDPALLDPYLARVAISGLMTIYKPVEQPAADAASEGDHTEGAPLANVPASPAPPADITLPVVDPAAVDAAAEPEPTAADATSADPNAPAPPATTGPQSNNPAPPANNNPPPPGATAPTANPTPDTAAPQPLEPAESSPEPEPDVPEEQP